MKKLLGMSFLLALCLGLQMPNTAAAHWGDYGFSAIYGRNDGSPVWQYSYNGRVPPYFAVHPPVYYSGQINRVPYGSSPYAALPPSNCAGQRNFGAGAMSTSEAASTPGQMIVNPHFKPTSGKTTQLPTPAKSETAGIMIMNPHYVPTTRVAKQ